MSNCVYLDADSKDAKGHFGCYFHGRCVLSGSDRKLPSCDTCKEHLKLNDPSFTDRWRDPLKVIDRQKHPTESLRDMLAGASVFLLAGGPSVNKMPLEMLARRGVWTLAVNNVAGHRRIRPQAFVCSDPPLKFSYSIWMDPGIMKFVPTAKMRGYRARLRVKEDGRFYEAPNTINTCPNVWGFKRWSWMEPNDNFFLTDGACWGNHAKGVDKTGQPKTVCTMLLGLRLLRYLGARRVFLLGVDFRMDCGYGYSFPQGRDDDAVKSNNEHFTIVNDWLCKIEQQGVFRRFGLDVYNCYERSGLRAFPFIPFEEAVQAAQGVVETEPDLARWYEDKGMEKR